MEFILRGFFLCHLAGCNQLTIKLFVHKSEDDEGNQTNQKQGGAE